LAAPIATHEAARPELSPAQERTAIAALALAAFALNLNTNVLGALQPFLPAASIPEGPESFRWLLFAAAWGSAFGALLFGPVADRVGRRSPLLLGMAAFTVASVLHLAASGFVFLLVLRAASGFAVGIAYASASALAADIVPYGRRGRAMGVFTAGMFLAIPVGLPLAVLLADAGHWQAIFGVQAGFAVLGLVFALRAVPADGPRAHFVAPWNMLTRVPVLATLFAVMLHVGSFFTTVQMASRWLDRPELVPKAQQGLLWIVLGFASALGSFAFGRVGDRIGKRNFVLLSSVVLVGCFVLLTRVDSLSSLVPLGLVLAVVAAARTGPLQALTSGQVPAYELGTLMGLRAFCMQAGVGMFAAMAGSIEAEIGFAAVLYAAACCQALSFLAIRLFVREGR
jgi:predicted MFS family arabinose efflux permease